MSSVPGLDILLTPKALASSTLKDVGTYKVPKPGPIPLPSPWASEYRNLRDDRSDGKFDGHSIKRLIKPLLCVCRG